MHGWVYFKYHSCSYFLPDSACAEQFQHAVEATYVLRCPSTSSVDSASPHQQRHRSKHSSPRGNLIRNPIPFANSASLPSVGMMLRHSDVDSVSSSYFSW
jgi:hypothetical protein